MRTERFVSKPMNSLVCAAVSLPLLSMSVLLASALVFGAPGEAGAPHGNPNVLLRPDYQQRPEIAIQQGHNRVVRSVAFSPDGTLLASADAGTINVWEVSNGRMVRKLRCLGKNFGSLTFNHDGKLLIRQILDDDGGQPIGFHLWIIAYGNLVNVPAFESGQHFLASSPDDDVVVTESEEGILNFWDMKHLTLIKKLEAHEGKVDSAAFSGDQKLLCTLSWKEKTLKVWNYPELTLADVQTYEADVAGHGMVWRDGRFEFNRINNSKSKLDEDSRASEVFSPDGKLLATEKQGYSVKLWRVSDGERLINEAGHDEWAFSRDGKRLVSWRSELETVKTIKVWSVEDGKLLKEIVRNPVSGSHVAVSPDGSQLVVFGPGNFCQWLRTSDGRVTAGVEPRVDRNGGDHIASVEFSPDGRFLVICRTGSTNWLSTDIKNLSPKAKSRVEIYAVTGTVKLVNTLEGALLAISPDGKYIATRGSNGHCCTVELRSIDGGKIAGTFEVPEEVSWKSLEARDVYERLKPFVAFSSDGRLFAFFSPQNHELKGLKVWRTSDGALISEGQINSEGGFILHGSLADERTEGFSFRTGREIWRLVRDKVEKKWAVEKKWTSDLPYDPLGFLDISSQPSLSDDGRLFAYQEPESGIIRIGNLSTGMPAQSLQGAHHRGGLIGFSPGGKFLASGGSESSIFVKGMSDGRIVRELVGTYHTADLDAGSTGLLSCAKAFSPDGRFLAIGGWLDNSARMWRVSDGTLLRVFEGHNQGSRAIGFSPDSRSLAVGQDDGTIQLWNMQNGQLWKILSRHFGRVQRVTFSPDGKYLASKSVGGTTKLWRLSTGTLAKREDIKDSEGCIDSPNRGAEQWAGSLGVFSPDGSIFATQGLTHNIELWSVSDGALKRSFGAHNDCISNLSFSPDGKFLVSSSDDDVRLWRVSDGNLVRHFTIGVGVIAFFTSEGTLVALENGDEGLTVRRLLDGTPVKSFASAATPTMYGREVTAFHKRYIAFKHYSLNGRMTFWSTPEGKFIQAQGAERADLVGSCFSPDGNLFAAEYLGDHWTESDRARYVDGEFQNAYNYRGIWRTQDGRRIQSIQVDAPAGGQSEDPRRVPNGGLAFNPDGRFLASVAHDGAIKLFGRINDPKQPNEEPFKLVLTLAGSPDGEWIAFTPEGYYDASPEGSSLVSWVFRSSPGVRYHVPGEGPVGPIRDGLPGVEGFGFEQFEKFFYKPEIVKAILKGNFDAGSKLQMVERPPYLEMPDHLSVKQTSEARYPLKFFVSNVPPHELKTVRIFVNGKPTSELQVNLEGYIISPDFSLSEDVPLFPDLNRITVIAYDERGFSSNPRYVDVLCTSGGLAKPNLHILAIGVSKYPSLPSEWQLDYAHTDARHIVEAFKKQEGQIFEKVYQSVLTNEEVTPQKVMDNLDALKEIRETDVAVVFLAGHGVQSRDGVFYFLTSTGSREEPEKGGLAWKQLGKPLSRIKGRVIVLLDACHSGGITTETVVPNDELAHQLTQGGRSGVMVFAASKRRQSAVESPDIARGFGTFTHALCQAVGPKAKEADMSGNGFVKFSELVEFVTRQVHSETGGEQTPWLARRELFGDFPVAKVLPSK